MYINEFLAGVLATLLVELIFFFGYAVYANKKSK